jgi:SAM-dependent methyltransferase
VIVRPLEEVCLLLRCPACRTAPMRAAEAAVECPACGQRYPAAGHVDLVGAGSSAAASTGGFRLAQELMLMRPLAAIYERLWRPAFVGALSLWSIPFETEWFITRNALGVGERRGPWLDLSCGPGLYARRMSGAAPDEVVVGVDLSRAMLERAAAERPPAARRLHFVRGDAHDLPFREGAFSGVNNGAALHLYDDPARAMREVHRVLAPGGIYVGSTIVWTASVMQPFMRLAGTKIWRSDELRRLLADAGLVGFEEARLRGATLFRARRA